jgi:endogenous inhibitor of DNA gyrase (YacG/DUF329 family)
MILATVKCPKCGANVQIDTGMKFTKCTYCSSQIYLDRSGAGFYYVLPFMSDQNASIGIFRRWAAGSTKAKDLDQLAQVKGVKKQYFPVYMFKRDVNGVEHVLVEPAGSTTLPGLHSLKVPAGDLKIFDTTFDVGGAELIKPDIEMLSYMSNLPGKPKEQALVYFPIWNINYSFEGKDYNVVVDGVSGEVFSALYPVRGSAPYMLVAIVGFLAFIGEGLLAMNANLRLVAIILMVVTVIGIFGLAMYVARRL